MMRNGLKMKQFTPLLAATVLVVSCATTSSKRVQYPASTPPSEVAEQLKAGIQEGYERQFDVLANDHFRMAEKRFEQAKKQMNRGVKSEKVLNTLGDGMGHLIEARRRADELEPRFEGVLDARRAALNAGVRNYPKPRRTFREADDEFRSLAASGRVTSDEFARLQARYLDLELAAIQSQHLQNARWRIETAKKKRAAKFSPRSLRHAEIELRNAENMITAHRHDPKAFLPAVTRANNASEFLLAVIQKTRSGRDHVAEDVAIRLVNQERAIAGLSQQLKATEAQREAGSEIVSMQEQELRKARASQALEKAMNRARQEFARDEAEVYREGDRLLIRLKAMHFPVGRADLPAESVALLAKLKRVAEDIHPEQIVVEGHTDSTGSVSINQPLSQKRAEVVADYLQKNGVQADKITAVGYGFEKPISNNKTAKGRAENRRVDIILTPHIPETATTSM